jgi:hypothetical protein
MNFNTLKDFCHAVSSFSAFFGGVYSASRAISFGTSLSPLYRVTTHFLGRQSEQTDRKRQNWEQDSVWSDFL